MDFFKKEGWAVEISELSQKIFTPKGIFNKTSDLFGADLIMMNSKDIVFVQVKSNRVEINKGLVELKRHPFPLHVQRWVVIWEHRARQPEIIEVESE